jgi:hypothetical protein
LKRFYVVPYGTRNINIDPLLVELIFCEIFQPPIIEEFFVIISKNSGEVTVPITGLLNQFSASLYHLCINVTLQDSGFKEWVDPKLAISDTKDSLIIQSSA